MLLEGHGLKRQESIGNERSAQMFSISTLHLCGTTEPLPTYCLGANILTPRTCVSLPFMWFEIMAIWMRWARIGSPL